MGKGTVFVLGFGVPWRGNWSRIRSGFLLFGGLPICVLAAVGCLMLVLFPFRRVIRSCLFLRNLELSQTNYGN